MKRICCGAAIAAMSIVGAGSALAQVTPYDGDPATAAGYFTDEFFGAIPVALPIIAGIMIVFWLWFRITRAGGARTGGRV